MSDYGLKISRDGYNVLTCTDKQLSYSSKFPTFTVKTSGTINVVLSSGYTRKRETVSHGLGYTPAFVAYGKKSSASSYDKISTYLLGDGVIFEYLAAWADSTYVYFEAQYLDTDLGAGAPSQKTYNFKYYIFNNQIA